MTRVIPVAGCAIIRRGKLLLLFKKSHRHYEFPGGKVQVGESLRKAALRETLEEIGCKVKLGKYSGFFHIRDKHPRYHYKAHVFLAELPASCRPRVMDYDDFRDLEWIPLKQFAKYPLAENVRRFIASQIIV